MGDCFIAGNIWGKCLEVTLEYKNHPLHSYFIDFDPIIKNLQEKKYETPSEWFENVCELYEEAINIKDPKISEEKVEKIVSSLWKSFSKSANFLNISDTDEWVENVREEMIKSQSIITQCPYPYCVNPKLYKFFELTANESLSTIESINKASKLLSEAIEDKSTYPNDRDISQYYIGAIKDKILDMNQYEFISVIGHGSFGEVTRERDVVTKKEVAVKYFTDKEIKSRSIDIFYREVSILAFNQHSCILPFLGFSCTNRENNPSLIIVTEYMSNGSLRTLLDNERIGNHNKEWTGTKKTLTAFGIALGMKHLHDQEVIHRDLKTMNILLDDNFLPKIADLGLSKFFVDDNRKNTTKIGSIRWMAPEVMSSNEYNKKADVYSYGLILFEILTNNLPYEDIKTLNEFINAQKAAKRPNIPFPTPKALSRLISMCWSANPHLRPSFDEIVDLFIKEEIFYEDTDPNDFLITAQHLMNLKTPPISFCSAVAKNLIPIVKNKLKETNVNFYDEKKRYCLHIAVFNNSNEMVNLLLSDPRIDVNASDSNGQTSLHHAVINNQCHLIMSLLACPKLDVNIKDNSGKTALYLAVDSMNMNAIMALLSQPNININSGPKNDTPLVLASRKNFNDALSIFIASGKANMEMSEHIELLKKAIMAGNVPVVSTMLRSSSINTILEQNQTLLKCATCSTPQMLMLILSQPNFILKSEVIIPLINEAITNRNMQLIYACLMLGKIDFNYGNEKYPPPLIPAVYTNNIYAATLLLKWPQINVNVRSASWPGYSPLHYAAQMGFVEITKLLLSTHGINKDIKSMGDMTPLQVAEKCKNPVIIELLKK